MRASNKWKMTKTKLGYLSIYPSTKKVITPAKLKQEYKKSSHPCPSSRRTQTQNFCISKHTSSIPDIIPSIINPHMPSDHKHKNIELFPNPVLECTPYDALYMTKEHNNHTQSTMPSPKKNGRRRRCPKEQLSSRVSW
jgi:hypothetical protein